MIRLRLAFSRGRHTTIQLRFRFIQLLFQLFPFSLTRHGRHFMMIVLTSGHVVTIQNGGATTSATRGTIFWRGWRHVWLVRYWVAMWSCCCWCYTEGDGARVGPEKRNSYISLYVYFLTILLPIGWRGLNPVPLTFTKTITCDSLCKKTMRIVFIF